MPTGTAVRYDNPLPVIGNIDEYEEIVEVVGGHTETVPYPTQLNKPILFTYVRDNAINLGLPYSRRGLLGDSCTVKNSRDNRFLTMSNADLEAIVHDLCHSIGYLGPDCLTLNAFREPFAKYGEPPLGYEPPGRKWFK